MDLVLISEPEPGIVILTLNDPDNLNAMSLNMASVFKSRCHELEKRCESLRAIILTGAGRAFSSGGHLEMLNAKRSLSPDENRRAMIDFYGSFLNIRSLNIPIIAAVHGATIGAALCLACGCDIRVASQNTKLGFTFTKIGLHPGMGATFLVADVVGASKAKELLVTGRIIDSKEAERIGLVTKVVDDGGSLEESISIAREIKSCGPLATRQLVESLRNAPQNLKQALEREATCQSINYAGAEFAEGLAALREKRKAAFS